MSRIPAAGVYAIENTVTGRIYVGSAVNLVNRMAYHKSTLNTGYTNNQLLAADLKEHGKESFQITILQRTADVAELEYLERMWAMRLGALGANGYNAADVRKYVRNFNPSAELVDEFNRNALLILEAYPDDREAARAMQAHGITAPTGGAKWTHGDMARLRKRLMPSEDAPA